LQQAGAPSERLDPHELAAVKRLIAQRCIYGVDLNPMAVELAKVSLWLETLAEDEPLSFLDAHLRVGDSLVGAPEAVGGEGPRLDQVPDAAFGAVRKEAPLAWKAMLRGRRKQNARDRSDRLGLPIFESILADCLRKGLARLRDVRAEVAAIDLPPGAPLAEKAAAERRKAAAYATALEEPSIAALREVADLWTAVWFWPEDPGVAPPTTHEYQTLAGELLDAASDEREPRLDEVMAGQRLMARRIAAERRFHHRWLEFPEVEAAGGYGVVVGNPPWETVNSDRKEFLVAYDAGLIALEGKALDAGIAQLFEREPPVAEAWARETLLRAQQSEMYAASGLYTWHSHKGGGYINTYRLFFERAARDLRPAGQLALILAGGFALKDNATELRRATFNDYRLRFLVLSDNERKIYPAISDRVEWCLVHLSRDAPAERLPCVFLVGKLADGGWRSLTLSDLVDLVRGLPKDAVQVDRSLLLQLNPDTLRPPLLNDPRDADLLSRIFKRFHRFESEASGWRAVFGREIDSSGDREHFTHVSWLKERGAERVSPVQFRLGSERYAPLYEGRNIWLLRSDYTDPKLWIRTDRADALLKPNPELGGLRSNESIRVVWRDISRYICERTMVAAIAPAGTTSKHKLPYVRAGSLDPNGMVLLAGLWASFAFDWQLRTQGINALTFGPLRAQPVPTPDALRDLLSLVLAALEPDWLRAQAADAAGCSPVQLPCWRARAKLDAAIFGLYGFDVEDARYVLSTFPMLDREQPPLPGDARSTVTRDVLLAEMLSAASPERTRAEQALAMGAIPYTAEPQVDQSREWAAEEEAEADVEEAMA